MKSLARKLVLLSLFTSPVLARAGEPQPPVPVGTQPHGGLSGKIIYTHGGHGFTADNLSKGKWTFQRGAGHGMNEDLGNYDQMAFLVDYLFRAGATIVPLRPVGHQPIEFVIDNDSPDVSFTGEWKDGSEPIYFGKPGTHPYREAATSKQETAVARYTPQIKEAGFYPVYAWTSSGPNRATDQLYRVRHAGGATEVRVNHRRTGNGLVYLGTYYFNAGKDGGVEISNKSESADSVVVADMIRFGNGMSDIDRGSGVSGLSREDETGLYWVKWHADRAQGVPESAYRETDNDRQAAISFSPRYAAFMNREADGRLKDRVFVSFHSNAGGGGKARGTLGLFNGNNDPTTATPNQKLLANSLARKVNDDLVTQKGQFEHDWHDRGKNVTLDRDDIDFGEINNKYIHDEFDATIVEVAFHDQQEDSELMRDPRVRDAIARATYQGLLNYFRTVDNNETPTTRLPTAVTNVRTETTGNGEVRISWKPPATGSYLGDAATGYKIYASTNGYGFDGGSLVAGGDATNTILKGLDSSKPCYFKVVATNEGGESATSEVVAAIPSGGPKNILIVNGFDRLDRELDPQEKFGGKGPLVDRVRPRQSNSRDYVVQVATALNAASPDTQIDSTSNEAVANGDVELSKYRTVFWILGEESTHDFTFDESEQKLVEKFIAGGGNLFVSGTEIGFDLDFKDHGREFFNETLGARFVEDSAKTYEVKGSPAGPFADLSFKFDNGSQYYDAQSTDVLSTGPSAQPVFEYANSAGVAGIGIRGTGGRGSVIMLAIPFETIMSPETQAEIARRTLTFFGQK